jgi:hypothetical protein
MILGGMAEIVLGVNAEGMSLEDIARPLGMVRKAVGAVTGKPVPSSSARPPKPGPAAGAARKSGRVFRTARGILDPTSLRSW